MRRTRLVARGIGLLFLATSILVLVASASGAAEEPYSRNPPSKRPSPPPTPAPAVTVTVTPPPQVLGRRVEAPRNAPKIHRVPRIPAEVTPQQQGVLPFTGADVLIYGLGGAATVMTGFALTRFGRSKRHKDAR
jgi:hypothetical protein